MEHNRCEVFILDSGRVHRKQMKHTNIVDHRFLCFLPISFACSSLFQRVHLNFMGLGRFQSISIIRFHPMFLSSGVPLPTTSLRLWSWNDSWRRLWSWGRARRNDEGHGIYLDLPWTWPSTLPWIYHPPQTEFGFSSSKNWDETIKSWTLTIFRGKNNVNPQIVGLCWRDGKLKKNLVGPAPVRSIQQSSMPSLWIVRRRFFRGVRWPMVAPKWPGYHGCFLEFNGIDTFMQGKSWCIGNSARIFASM